MVTAGTARDLCGQLRVAQVAHASQALLGGARRTDAINDQLTRANAAPPLLA